MANDKENKGLFKKILKFFGICTLGATIALSGLVMTACSSNNPIDPPSDDGYHEVIDGDQIQDEIPGDDDYIVVPGPGTGDVIEDPSQGGGENNPPAQEEQPGEEIEDPGQGGGGGQQQEEPGENQEEQEEIDYASLLYYEDEDGITHYNTEKMVETYFNHYNNKMAGTKTFAEGLVGVSEINSENTQVWASNYYNEGGENYLGMLISVNDGTNTKLMKVTNKIDLSQMSENSISSLAEHLSGLNVKKTGADVKTFCIYENTFVAGEDAICDAITEMGLGNGQYVIGFKCEAKEHFSTLGLGATKEIVTYNIVNENGNVVLKEYVTYSSTQMGDSWKDNIKSKENCKTQFEKDVVIFENYTMQSQKTATAGFEIII